MNEFDNDLSVTEQAQEYARCEALDGRERERQEDVVEAGFYDVAALESLIDALEDARDTEGLTQRGAILARVQVAAVQNRYGFTNQIQEFPSLESFNGRQARLATTVSLETVGETIAKIWEWIKEQVEAFWDLIVKYWHQFTKNLNWLQEKSRKMKDYVRRNKFEGGGQINLGFAANNICYEGEVSEDFVTVFNAIAQVSRVSEDTFNGIQEAILEATKKALNPVRDSSGYLDKGAFTTSVLVPSGWKPTRELGRFEFGAAASRAFVSNHLPGDRVIVVGVFGSDNKPSAYDYESRQMLYGRVLVVKAKDYIKPNGRVKQLDSEEIFTLCQRIDKAIGSLKTSRDEVESHLKKTKAAIDQLVADHSAARNDNVVVQQYRKSVAALWKGNLYGTKLLRMCETIGFEVCAGYLVWAEKSIKLALKEQDDPTAQAVAAASFTQPLLTA